MRPEAAAPEICPDRDTLAAFRRGDLPLPELERLAGHLSGCDRCEGALQALQDDTLVGHLRAGGGRDPLLEEPECGQLEARAQGLAVEAGTPTVSEPRP